MCYQSIDGCDGCMDRVYLRLALAYVVNVSRQNYLALTFNELTRYH